MAKKWMAKAFKNAHGQLTAEAKKAWYVRHDIRAQELPCQGTTR